MKRYIKSGSYFDGLSTFEKDTEFDPPYAFTKTFAGRTSTFCVRLGKSKNATGIPYIRIDEARGVGHPEYAYVEYDPSNPSIAEVWRDGKIVNKLIVMPYDEREYRNPENYLHTLVTRLASGLSRNNREADKKLGK